MLDVFFASDLVVSAKRETSGQRKLKKKKNEKEKTKGEREKEKRTGEKTDRDSWICRRQVA